jgi:hypothetical protein
MISVKHIIALLTEVELFLSILLAIDWIKNYAWLSETFPSLMISDKRPYPKCLIYFYSDKSK